MSSSVNADEKENSEGTMTIRKTTTTISTIAVRAEPHTTIVIAMLKSLGFAELRIDEMKPGLLELGHTADESRQLLDAHNDLVDRLMSKQQQVEDLLTRADNLVSEQKEQNDILVYEAMAESLGATWKELNRQLELRGYILFDAHHLHQVVQEHEERVRETKKLLRDAISAHQEGNIPENTLSIESSIDVGVDLGSQLIAQIRVLGSLADSEQRPQEVFDACLYVEKLMLGMAQQWEVIDAFWGEERTRLQRDGAEGDGDLDKRERKFLEDSEAILAQMEQMRDDLISSSSASMAGELGPLAHQKAGPLIHEGRQLLLRDSQLSHRDEVAAKVEELRSKSEKLIQLARERISAAKAGNERLKEKLNSLLTWLELVIEQQLRQSGVMGSSGESAQQFVSQHKRLGADVMGREAEVASLFAHAPDLAGHDRKLLAALQQKYETARGTLETRLQLGRIFEQVHKFARELDNSFDMISSLLKSDVGMGRDNSITQQIGNVYRAVRETLYQERHQGEKFISNAQQLAGHDKHLATQEPIGSIRRLLAEHERRFNEIAQSLEHSDARTKAQEPPQLISPLTNHQVDEGSRVVLSAKVACQPSSTLVEWTKDGLDVKGNSDYRAEYNKVDGSFTLTIEESFVEDTALYRLKVWNELGSVETAANLVVRSKSQPRLEEPESGKPVFVKPLQAASIVEGGTAVLDCIIVANPEPQVIWYREDGEVLKETERIRLHFRGDHCSLSLVGASPADSGLYKVRAINVHGETSSFCRLNVTSASPLKRIPPATPPKPASPAKSAVQFFATTAGSVQPPTFNPSLGNQLVTEGQRVVLEVGVVGQPFPHIEWYFNDSKLDANTGGRITISSPQIDVTGIVGSSALTSRLVIERVGLEDVGIYMVVANNDSGEARSGASLNVVRAVEESGVKSLIGSGGIDSPRQFEERTQHRVQVVSEIATSDSSASPPPPVPLHRSTAAENDYGNMDCSSLANAPQFIRAFQPECTVNEGEKIRLDSLMVGNPRPRIQWFFNEQPLKSDYRFVEFLNVGDTYSIQLSPAKLEHAGYYRMVAENVRGRCECTSLLHVRPRSMQFNAQQQQQRGRSRQWGSMERKRVLDEFKSTAGYPILAPGEGFSNKKSTTQPPFTTGGSDRESESPTRNQHNWSSSFTARAMSASAHPAVPYQKPRQQRSTSSTISGDAPHFTQTLVSCVCAAGDEAKFEATVVGCPQPEVYWSKDGVELLAQENEKNAMFEFVDGGEDGHVALVFRAVRLEDAGKYMCTAKNISGVATSSAQLVIRARTDAPDFIQRLVSEEIAEGERLQWTVEVSGDPQPTVTWLRDGQPISDCEEARLIQNASNPNQYSMLIERVEMADAGQFTCLLTNSAGEARSTADLLVRESGAEPGSYFHITKVMQEKQVRGEELSRNQVFSIGSVPSAPPQRSSQQEQVE